LNLQFYAFIGYFKKARRTWEQFPSKIGKEPEGIDIHVKFVDHSN
tara:strand:- start:492 stop:626 length:135 start_codon:yes stop_codon:yes gene_type:complete